MKVFKQVLLLAVLCTAMVLVGCKKKNETTTISVEVTKNGAVQPNVQVYMYDGSLQDVFLKSKVHATENIATDENGVAEFTIPEIFFATSDKATAIFETFDENEVVTGKVAASVSKGDSKKVTLKMN